MNEIQIRLSADISALTSALNKAKATIKSFESETAKESEKGNVGFKRKIGLIEQLTTKANTLRTALSKATNESQIEAYNKELQNTATELTRLNALGRTVTANLSGVGGGFNKVATQGGNATGVALEFNRVIQDAPFGLIGIGNNLQQLAGNFSTLKAQAGSTGKAVGLALTSIISPVNLCLLAVSALTAAFTAYQMGAFDFLKSNEEAAKSVKELADEIDNAISRTSAESANISALRTTIEDETLSREKRLKAVERLQEKYPEIFGNANKEKLLNGELIGSYELLTKAIIQRAEASLAEERIPDINKEKQAVDSLIKVKQKQLETESALAKSLSTFVPQGQIFSQADIAKAKANDLKKEIDDLSLKSAGLQVNIDGFTQSIVTYQQEFIDLLEPIDQSTEKVKDLSKSWEETEDAIIATLRAQNKFVESTNDGNKFKKATSGLTGKEGEDEKANAITEIENAIAASMEAIGLPIKEYADEAEKIKETNNIILDSFSSLASGIVSSLDISNNSLRGFISLVLSAAPKIISAIIAQAAAKKAADAQIISSNAQVAGSEAVAVGAKAANALGPVGLALLPVFIGGALAIVGGAFSKLGKGGAISGGGGSAPSSGAPPQIFTNVNTVNPPSSTSPNYSGGSIDFNNAQSRMTVDIDGDKLKFIVDRANERRQAGG